MEPSPSRTSLRATTASRARTHVRHVESELFDAVVFAPDRDHCPGARPVVSVSEHDEREFLDAVDACAGAQVSLERRGVQHGDWAELDPVHVARAKHEGAARVIAPAHLGALQQRWCAARPVVLHGALSAGLDECAADIEQGDERHTGLKEARGLARWLATRADSLAPHFRALAKPANLFDPERDIERVFFEAAPPPGRQKKRIADLWVKSSWLSTWDDDDSLRVRVSFGRERDDDASGDLVRHRMVSDLAQTLLPESAVVHGDTRLVALIERLCGEPVLFTQHIAYWNSPGGGALFHHDAFAEDADVAGHGQLGVCYAQLSGRTAWLALSTADLASRVVEFAELLALGEMPWVRQQLFGDPRAYARFRSLVDDPLLLQREIASPGCGRLGALVNRGPEFTSFLADAGHAALLGTGDVILLPNHGILHTAMHSVFCASDETAYSLSIAIRPQRAPQRYELDGES